MASGPRNTSRKMSEMTNLSKKDQDEINRRADYHPPTSDQVEVYEKLRATYKEHMTLLYELCPDSRERSLALTHLEQVSFYANSSIARNT